MGLKVFPNAARPDHRLFKCHECYKEKNMCLQTPLKSTKIAMA